MIDWLSLNIEVEKVSIEALNHLHTMSDKIMKIDPDGQIIYEMQSRTSIRSDSHQISVHFNAHCVMVYGSPARVMGDGNENVFGSSHLESCGKAMIDFVARVIGHSLPNHRLWSCTKIDYTLNYNLQNSETVDQALQQLQLAHSLRYKPEVKADSTYWGTQSQWLSGKAYHKGKHLTYLNKINKDITKVIPDWKIKLAQKILRLELSIKRQYLHKTGYKSRWYEMPVMLLIDLHEKFFNELIGTTEVTNVKDIKQNLMITAIGKKFGGKKIGKKTVNNAYKFFLECKQIGYANAASGCHRNTVKNYRDILGTIGVSITDLKSGNIVPFRREPIRLYQAVTSWPQLREAA